VDLIAEKLGLRKVGVVLGGEDDKAGGRVLTGLSGSLLFDCIMANPMTCGVALEQHWCTNAWSAFLAPSDNIRG
jgi:hypothetical protein